MVLPHERLMPCRLLENVPRFLPFPSCSRRHCKRHLAVRVTAWQGGLRCQPFPALHPVAGRDVTGQIWAQSSRSQMFRKLMGLLGSPCDCSLIGAPSNAL
jgi:hypothetical protein